MASGEPRDLIEGAAVASSSASLVSALWGVAYALQGKGKDGAKRLFLSGALVACAGALRTVPEMIQNNQEMNPFSVVDPSLTLKPSTMEKLQLWIDAHQGGTARHIAAKFIEITRYVSFDEFEKHFQISVEKFEEWYLPLRNEQNKFAIVTSPPPEKSNHWVTSLAKYFKQLPDHIVYYRQASGDLDDFVKNHPEVNTFVYLDDKADYSCYLDKHFLGDLHADLSHAKAVSQQKNEFSIASIIPFVKAPDCMAPKPYIDNFKSFYSEIIQPIKNLLTPEELTSFTTLYGQLACADVPLADLFPIYFDHKIAGCLSTFTQIYRDGVVSPYSLNWWIPNSSKEKKIRFIEPNYSPV